MEKSFGPILDQFLADLNKIQSEIPKFPEIRKKVDRSLNDQVIKSDQQFGGSFPKRRSDSSSVSYVWNSRID